MQRRRSHVVPAGVGATLDYRRPSHAQRARLLDSHKSSTPEKAAYVTWLVQPRLINDPFSDPGLLIDFRFGRRAILFDLGDIHALASREVLRITHVFVSHAHMDHFAGFDRLLRLCLGRPMPVQLVGPDGFIDRVRHKLGSYTWNLLDDRAPDFSILALDFYGRRLSRACTFRACKALPPETA